MAETYSQRLTWRRWIETAIVVVLVGAFAALVADRYQAYRRLAEIARMQLDVSTMRSALGVALVERSARGGWPAMRALNGSNPVRLLLVPPAGYRGSLARLGETQLKPDQWGFDASRGVLVYRLPVGTKLAGSWSHPPRQVFRIVVTGSPTGGNARAELTLVRPRMQR